MLDYDQVVEQMELLFQEQIANWEHSPRVFEYQVKLASWMVEKAREQATNTSATIETYDFTDK